MGGTFFILNNVPYPGRNGFDDIIYPFKDQRSSRDGVERNSGIYYRYGMCTISVYMFE